MIGIFSHSNGITKSINCSENTANDIVVGRDGYYFIPLNNEGKPMDGGVVLGSDPKTGLVKYFSSKDFKGLGPKIAEKITDDFGIELIYLLKKRSFLAIEEKTSKKILEGLTLGWDFSSDNSGFEILFSQLGFSFSQKKFVKEEVGFSFFTEIHRDPYMMLQKIPRLKFENIENIILQLGIIVTEEQKIVAATRHSLLKSEQERGNTCGPLEKVVFRVQELGNFNLEKIESAINEATHLFHQFKFNGKNFLETKESQERDIEIVNQVIRINSRFKAIEEKQFTANKNAKSPLSDEQVMAIQNSISSPVSIITGGPGTGKTRIIEGLAQVLVRSFKKTIRVCAPTGRAAKRIAENPALKSFKPSTIHMLMATIESSTDTAKFDALIVDESSMIDINLFKDLVKLVPDRAQLILIGDVDQLPPVGPGQPFLDLIRSGEIIVSRLTKQFRQGSKSNISAVAKAVNRGEMIDYSSDLISSDFSFVDVEKRDIIQEIIKALNTLTESGKDQIDLENTQILSPMRRYPAGLTNLNTILQKKYNPNSKKVFSKLENETEVNFFINDKVICTTNDYELDVRNGDIGYIVNKIGRNIQIDFDGKTKLFHENRTDIIDLAYAITVHKSQGSEYANVLMPIVDDHRIMLTRKLIYTAITRGKQKVCLIGSKSVFKEALRRVYLNLRYTNLFAKFKESKNDLFS